MKTSADVLLLFSRYHRIVIVFSFVMTFSASLCSQIANAEVDAKVMNAVKTCEPDARSLLRQLVQIDSGTADAPGLAAVGSILMAELERLGANVETLPAPPAVGDNVVATFSGQGKGRILLVAHIDTVFPAGTVAQRPYRVVGDRGFGPGTADDKAGTVAAICALRVLRDIQFRDYARITLILNSNEETGSAGTRDLIRAKAKESHVAINLERGVLPDGVEITRKGSAVITLVVTGRGAHSGLEPERGRNAAIEAAHQALQLGSLADPVRETTVNVTIIQGGIAINVIPDSAVIKADVRAFTVQEFDRVENGLKKLAADTIVPDIQVKASMTRNFPPWPRAASTDALLTRAQKLYAEIGRTLNGVAVGSSADVAFAAETGTPSIDGFGLVGDGSHGPEEYVDLSSIVPRVYLLARMLMDLGHNPPIEPSSE
jgi:glutamate carboxypeptidase